MGTSITDFFGPGANLKARLISDYGRLAEIVNGIRVVQPELKIVLISGSWDMKHVGHDRYLGVGSEFGDVTIVGIDSDAKVAKRKGPNRPVVPEDERIEQLCHLRYVNLVVPKNIGDPKWHLIKTVRPDFLITIKENYTDEQREQLKEFCGKVIVLERQAETSTSAKVRRLVMNIGLKAQQIAEEELKAASKKIGERIHGEVEKS